MKTALGISGLLCVITALGVYVAENKLDAILFLNLATLNFLAATHTEGK